MMRIAITGETIRDDEADMITVILDHGWDMVHLRHPGATMREIQHIIEAIPQRLHRRLRLHGHFELINSFNLGGLHLNRRCPEPPPNYNGTYSRSCHSIEEVVSSSDCDYVTLSPIFDSISKPGYKRAFTFNELQRINHINNPRIIALGGITPENVAQIHNYNFAGFAVIGSLMNAESIKDLTERLLKFDNIK